jgi:hypothetical protein
VALERALPKKAVVFLHHWHLSLGINRPVFLDWVGFQGSIDYRAYATARDFYDRLRALGVTHVVHLPGNQMAPSKQEDAIFQSLTLGYGGPKQRFGMFEMYPLPETPPPQRAPIKVLVAGLPPYADGLYDVSALGVCHNLPAHLQHYPPPSVSASVGFGSLIDAADVLLTASGAALDPVATERLAREFHAAVPYPGLAVYVRMPPRS